MTTSTQYSPSDLVLRLAGGKRDGELVTVTTPKCLISTGAGTENAPQCAIFRGPHGTAVRTFDSQVAFNGAVDSVHWLKAGDRIDFGNAIAMEVTQLGKLQVDSPISGELATDVDLDFGRRLVDGNRFEDHCLNQIRIQVSKIQSQNSINSEKFALLDEKLNLLTDHLNELIFVAKEGRLPLADSSANPVTRTNVAPTNVAPTNVAPTNVAPLTESDEEKIFSSLDWKANEQAVSPLATTSHQEIDPYDDDKISSLTADEQVEQAFAPMTHSDVEGADSSAVESTAAPNEFDNSNSLAQQLLNDLAMDEDQAPENEPVPEISGASETATQATVGDLLEKYRTEEYWQQGSEVLNSDETPVELNDADTPVPLDSENAVWNDDPEQSTVDVHGYVADLINRMRIPGQQLFSDFRPSDSKQVAAGSQLAAEAVPEENKTPFNEGEFKPAKKAQKIELSAMREIANTNTRRNIQVSEESRRKELGKIRILVAVFSFFLAVYYFLFVSVGQLNLGFITGFCCVSITGFLTYKLYQTMRFNEMLELEKMTVSMNEAKESVKNQQVGNSEKSAEAASK
ncbi:MAG: hypothetical protein ACPIA2_05465 [Mariniblastus sp.]